MQPTAVSVAAHPEPLGGLRPLIGKCFVHPVVDYLLVGGGITIPLFIAIYFYPWLIVTDKEITLYTFLFINGAHFAATVLRLYTKPGAKNEFPFLSWGFPVICLATVAAGLHSDFFGKNLTALYLTWSPFHYAAQTYGLAVIYSMRSGARLEQRDKMQIRWVCLLPFFYALLTAPDRGLAWFVAPESLSKIALLASVHSALVSVVTIGVMTLPFLLFWQLHKMRSKKVPLIVLVLQISNSIWWLTASYLGAFWWAAIFHSIQYLIIIAVMHTRERMAQDNPRRGALHRPWFYSVSFYLTSSVLSGILFFAVPMAYVPFGSTALQAVLMMAIVINIHHFVVDAFIWRTKAPQSAVSASQGLPVAV